MFRSPDRETAIIELLSLVTPSYISSIYGLAAALSTLFDN